MRARARYREEGINFNPTLVQLECVNLMLVMLTVIYFNPTLVQLE